jgi:hypothetical protein
MRNLVPAIALAILGLAAGCSGKSAGKDASAAKPVDGEVQPAGDGAPDGHGGIDSSLPVSDGPSVDESLGDAGLPDEATREDGVDAAVALGPDGESRDAPGRDGPDPASPDADAGIPLCNAPACFAELKKDCQPAGACVQQLSGNDTNQCYDNGVMAVTVTDASALKMSTKVSKAARTCYVIEFDLAAAMLGKSEVGLIRDGSGAIVAVLGDDPSGRNSVTCTGGQPVVLNEGCDFTGGASTCAAGACGP